MGQSGVSNNDYLATQEIFTLKTVHDKYKFSTVKNAWFIKYHQFVIFTNIHQQRIALFSTHCLKQLQIDAEVHCYC